MKSGFAMLVRAYFAVGGFLALVMETNILALVMETTYMWAIGWGAPAGVSLMEKVSAHLWLEPVFIFSAFVRMLFWLPSLIAWLANPGETTFMMWLAPGLGAQVFPAPQS